MIKMEEKTQNNTGLKFNIAFNYGGRDEIVKATQKIAKLVKDGKLDIENITEDTISNNLYTAGLPDPDLLIRASGELRTSNFLPWQITYSEFMFLDKYWPDFTTDDIDNAIEEFSKRHRRVGKEYCKKDFINISIYCILNYVKCNRKIVSNKIGRKF